MRWRNFVSATTNAGSSSAWITSHQPRRASSSLHSEPLHEYTQFSVQKFRRKTLMSSFSPESPRTFFPSSLLMGTAQRTTPTSQGNWKFTLPHSLHFETSAGSPPMERAHLCGGRAARSFSTSLWTESYVGRCEMRGKTRDWRTEALISSPFPCRRTLHSLLRHRDRNRSLTVVLNWTAGLKH
jgi:hypothetical protein